MLYSLHASPNRLPLISRRFYSCHIYGIIDLSQDAKHVLDNITYWMGGTSFFGFLANAAAGDVMPTAIAAITPYVVFLTSLGTLALLIYNFTIKILDRRSLKQRSKEIHDIVQKSSGREKQ